MSVELIYGLMAALPLLPFAIASRRAGWAGVVVGLLWLMCHWQGVVWPGAQEPGAIDGVGLVAELLMGLLYAGPMLCTGLYGLALNPSVKPEERVSVAA